MTHTIGIDVGSVSSQCVIVADGELYAYNSMRTGNNSPDSAKNAFLGVSQKTGLTLNDVHMVVGTGYGRVNVPFAHKAITEIACHARGANYMGGNKVRTILDMGGQDCKAIHCDDKGKVTSIDLIILGAGAAGGARAAGGSRRKDQRRNRFF